VDTVLFLSAFVTVVVIMDPIGNVPIFLSLTRGWDDRARQRAAWQATAVAAGVIATFAVFGQGLLEVIAVSLEALQVAGGLLLLGVAVELLHPAGSEAVEPAERRHLALVPLGTPLLAGPGAIATTMVYVRRADDAAEVATVFAALALALVVVWLALRFAVVLGRHAGEHVVRLLSRVFGFLLAAIAVQLIAEAVERWIRHGVA
jgi:multiple antibiotic resistance protein